MEKSVNEKERLKSFAVLKALSFFTVQTLLVLLLQDAK